jgi:hypothetical protein
MASATKPTIKYLRILPDPLPTGRGTETTARSKKFKTFYSERAVVLVSRKPVNSASWLYVLPADSRPIRLAR